MMPFLCGAAGSPSRYLIARSLRFNSADSAYLNRTPAGAGNRQTWTFSSWVKRSGIGAASPMFHAGATSSQSDTNWLSIGFNGSDQLQVWGWSTIFRVSAQFFRDPSAWYHIVIAVDTAQGSNNSIRCYVNGAEITAWGTQNNPGSSADTGVCSAAVHEIGYEPGNNLYANQYLADVYLIDGQQLTPSSFGMTDPATGQWVPIDASGIARGTTGFFLPFSDNSSTTTLGYDQGSGSNDWTLTNFSVTAGALIVACA